MTSSYHMSPELEASAGLIANAALYNKLVFFVGAGLSKHFNVKSPDWGQLVIEFLKDTNIEEDAKLDVLSKLKLGMYLDALEVLRPDNAKNFKEYIVNKFRYSGNLDEYKTRIHKLLLYVSEKFVTTNYDNIIELIFRQEVKVPRVYTNYNDRINLNKIKNEASYVYKIHGNADKKELESIVVFEDDYRQLYQHEKFIEVLKDILTHNTVVFLGFSFDDIYAKELIDATVLENAGVSDMLMISNNYWPVTKGVISIPVPDYGYIETFINRVYDNLRNLRKAKIDEMEAMVDTVIESTLDKEIDSAGIDSLVNNLLSTSTSLLSIRIESTSKYLDRLIYKINPFSRITEINFVSNEPKNDLLFIFIYTIIKGNHLESNKDTFLQWLEASDYVLKALENEDNKLKTLYYNFYLKSLYGFLTHNTLLEDDQHVLIIRKTLDGHPLINHGFVFEIIMKLSNARKETGVETNMVFSQIWAQLEGSFPYYAEIQKIYLQPYETYANGDLVSFKNKIISILGKIEGDNIYAYKWLYFAASRVVNLKALSDQPEDFDKEVNDVLSVFFLKNSVVLKSPILTELYLKRILSAYFYSGDVESICKFEREYIAFSNCLFESQKSALRINYYFSIIKCIYSRNEGVEKLYPFRLTYLENVSSGLFSCNGNPITSEINWFTSSDKYNKIVDGLYNFIKKNINDVFGAHIISNPFLLSKIKLTLHDHNIKSRFERDLPNALFPFVKGAKDGDGYSLNSLVWILTLLPFKGNAKLYKEMVRLANSTDLYTKIHSSYYYFKAIRLIFYYDKQDDRQQWFELAENYYKEIHTSVTNAIPGDAFYGSMIIHKNKTQFNLFKEFMINASRIVKSEFRKRQLDWRNTPAEMPFFSSLIIDELKKDVYRNSILLQSLKVDILNPEQWNLCATTLYDNIGEKELQNPYFIFEACMYSYNIAFILSTCNREYNPKYFYNLTRLSSLYWLNKNTNEQTHFQFNAFVRSTLLQLTKRYALQFGHKEECLDHFVNLVLSRVDFLNVENLTRIRQLLSSHSFWFTKLFVSKEVAIFDKLDQLIALKITND